MVFEILSFPIALLSPVRYQILADIESFAFLLFIAKRYLDIYSLKHELMLRTTFFLEPFKCSIFFYNVSLDVIINYVLIIKK